ncbi:MAG: helicase-exonuclease AddAB subunit AddA [Lachnospiraceae bacterium]|nr:helicase-exonuclease AddAB subunit AddA [Lachnospiraceae bacterium]
MGKIEYTPAQQKVIDIRNKNVLVSAAAGSGKTAVLTARIVDRICDKENPISIDRLLIVTFTEAAAAEMRERIGKAIADKLKENPDNDELRKQQTLVHSALIMTVHGFCLYLIRNHFDRIGIDPSFRVAAEEEARLLLEDSLEEVIAEYMEKEPDLWDMLEDRFTSGFMEGKIGDIVKDLHKTAEAQPFPEDWYDEMQALLTDFRNNPEGSELYGYAKKHEDETLKDCLAALSRAVELAEGEGGPSKYLPALYSDKAYVESLLAKDTIRERSIIHAAYTFPNIGRETASELKEIVKNSRDDCKGRLNKIREKLYLLDYDTALSDDVKNTELLSGLLKVSKALYEKYEANKRDKNLIDFSDMEHFALKILLTKDGGKNVPTDVALAYREHFAEVMVDEYQDSNYIQEELLKAVSKDSASVGNRFMVGDVKQSIYRFRLARPEIFREKYKNYQSDETARDVRIDLSSNFRSRTEVLNSVNRVFEDSMHEAVGEIEYNDAAKLYYGATFYGEPKKDCISELHVIPEEEWKECPERNKTVWEASVVGKRILELIEEKYQVSERGKDGVLTSREVRFSDMMILVRKQTGRAPYIKAVLEKLGIPTMVISKEGYFMAAEVILMLNFVSILNNPRQDIPLLGVLHSFLGGFSEKEIATIRGGNKNELLYDSLKRYATVGGEALLREKIKAFTEKLDGYRDASERESVYDLLCGIYEKEGVLNYYRAMNLGEQRVANLKILLQKAEEYAVTGFGTLADFVRYIENVKNREIDFGEANLLDENANVVRIYTMHKSKGLEFPVCFLMGLGENLSTSRDVKEVACDNSLGMGTDYADPLLRIKRKSFSRAVIQIKDSVEKRGEDLRLLYVAMTRAKEKLIMVGTIPKKLSEAMGTYGENRPFTTSEILSATTYMNYLLPEAERNSDLFDLRIATFLGTQEAQEISKEERSVRKEELKKTPSSYAGMQFEPYVYPHESLANVFTKTTVSDLKKAAYKEEEEAVDELFKDADGYAESGRGESFVPIFMRETEKKMSGALYGTAHHRVMELIDFSAFTEAELKDGSDEFLAGKVRKMREYHVNHDYIAKEEDSLVRTTSVVQFLKTDLALRMKRAFDQGKLYREQPFVLSLPATSLNPEFPSEEKVLVQGVIDVYFEEDGELVLMDYKTDSKVDEAELIKRYKAQLYYYSVALNRLEKKNVKEVLIYSFFLGKTIPVKVD